MTTITVTCRMCYKSINITLDKEQYQAWRKARTLRTPGPEWLIQNMLPNLTSGERELLISGVCEPCFDELFK